MSFAVLLGGIIPLESDGRVHPSLGLFATDRLEAIAASEFLDTGAISALDRVVRAAADLFAAPVAQLNQVTADRQIPVSYVGSEYWGRPVPLERSFCQHVVTSGEPLVVRDAREHPLLRRSSAATENPIAAYLSVPLRSASAPDLIATLCVVDFRPRDWTDADVRRLIDLSCWARSEVELRRGHRDVRLRSEAALQASATRLRLALESAHRGAWDLDLASGRMECTSQCKANFGHDAEERFDYADLLDAIHPEDRVRVRAAVERAIAERTDYEAEYRATWPDGTDHWIAARGTASYDSMGKAVRMTGVTQDVTERRRARVALEESEGRFRELADLSPDAILVTANRRFVYANDSAARLFGTSAVQEIVGRSPFDFIGAEHHELVRHRMRSVLDEEKRLPRVEQRWVRIDGSSVEVDVAAGPVVWGGVPAVQSVVRDVTEGKRAEEDLHRAKGEAEEASRAKSQFLAVMSHELRTPLNAILAYADLLLLETKGPITSGQTAQIERIIHGGRHLLELINEILTYARLEAGKEEVCLEAADAADLVQETIEMVRAITEQKGLDLRVDLPDEPLPFMTDPRKMRQVMLNLLANAAKFTESGYVAVAVVREDERVRIDVSDSGPGIPPNQIKAIWEPFRQAPSGLTREKGGTGLGLSVSLHLTRLLCGEITVNSAVGVGSTFTLRLPLHIKPLESGRRNDVGIREIPGKIGVPS